MGTVSGDVLGTPTNLPLFNLGPAANGSIPLLISNDLAAALTSMFELDDEIDLTGARFGLASTSPSVVPRPAGLPLLLAGVGGLALLRRRRPPDLGAGRTRLRTACAKACPILAFSMSIPDAHRTAPRPKGSTGGLRWSGIS